MKRLLLHNGHTLAKGNTNPLTASLREQVVRGVFWSFGSRIWTQLFQVTFGIILARLLSPEEFGIIGMLLVFIGFAQALADGGLSSALIYHQDAGTTHQSTVFWLQLVAGATLSILFFTAAPLLANFYAVPPLIPLGQLLSCIFFIQALGLVHNSLLMKQFRFKALAVANITSTLLAGLSAILLAMKGYGVWALAWQALITSTTLTLLLWLQSGWKPRLVFDGKIARELGQYGIYLLGHIALNYWLRNGSNLIIGKTIGPHALGVFARSYSLMLLPLNNVGAVLGQVMFPALTRVKHDITKFRQHYLSATRLIALVSFPMMVGVAVLAEPLILFLLGPKWAEVIPILQILSFVGMFQSIIFPVGWVFTALGKTKAQFKLSVFLVVAFVILMTFGVRYGLYGVTYAYAIWTLISGALNLHLIARYMNSSPLTIIVSVAQIALMTAFAGVLVFTIDHGLGHWSHIMRLIIGFIVGSISYIGLCIILRDATFFELMTLLSSRFGSLAPKGTIEIAP